MDSVVVFTSKSVDQILKLGGSGSWNLTPSKVLKMRYAVCTFCDTPKDDMLEVIAGRGLRGAAFLVGKISGVRPSGIHNGRQRYVIEFSEYAELDVPDIWDGSRNPVRYMPECGLNSIGLDFDSLEFKPMPEQQGSGEDTDEIVAAEGLTLSQAKAGLAVTFGVSVDQIQITISA